MGKFIDLTNKRFGMLAVIERGITVGRMSTWLCRCDCGRTKIIKTHMLIKYGTTNCGCIRKHENLIGRIFGKLTVKAFIGSKSGRNLWNCLCECGNESIACTTDLKRGYKKSCGCLLKQRNEYRILKTIKHGLSNSKLYRIHHGMKQRCYNPNKSEYARYGGRMIKMCDEWLGKNGFLNFYNWAINNGYEEREGKDKLTIERKDNNGNYEPSNCRWITNKEQQNNTSRNRLIEINGEIHSLIEWSKILKISYNQMRYKYKRGTL